jgi:predicted transcriptional regulator
VRDNTITIAAGVVSAYVSNNSVATADLPNLIAAVHAALSGAGSVTAAEVPRLVPAVPIKKSVSPDFIICLDDGKKFKSLKRHLKISYDMTPDQYRAKWDLPPDYPMVASNYAAARSAVAKRMGLGDRAKVAVTKKKR